MDTMRHKIMYTMRHKIMDTMRHKIMDIYGGNLDDDILTRNILYFTKGGHSYRFPGGDILTDFQGEGRPLNVPEVGRFFSVP